ncbi:MAG: hypothetical protein E6R04_08430 [Spirochaetes bacterium]|nr:MAG: hypothetical protein E6R04_08430 [Spirochaetota bacterium]
MTQDDRMETITDPAEIRATDEPDERTPNEVHVDESGCSCKTGPYRGFQRDPIDAACPKHGGPLRHGDGDVTVCHPDGSTTIIREPDERGDFPFYDLGPATSEARAAGGVDPKALAHALTTAHALIEAKAQLESVRHLLQLRSDALARVTREAEALRAKVAAVEVLMARSEAGGEVSTEDVRAALATGEGKHVAREVFTAEGIANSSDYGTGYQDGQSDELASIADTCCGKCPGGTCYVDQVTGA